jgi:hypothetical protein
MKKSVKIIIIFFISITSLSVVYSVAYRGIFYILNNRSIAKGEQIHFEEFSKGITWINRNNKKTLLFIPSSEEVASNELYGNWLKELHSGLGVNIIVPPSNPDGLSPGLSASHSVIERNIESIQYLYSMYKNLLGTDHKITIVSTGDGSLTALELAKQDSSMDKIILVSPVHNDSGSSRKGFLQNMEGLPLIHFILPWLPRSYGQNRVSTSDILNDNLNRQFQDEKSPYYPRYINMSYGRELKKKINEQFLTLDRVKSNRFFIIYGDDDLSYSLEGFERLGDQLSSLGSEVSVMRIPQSGRCILFDNGKERVFDLISILLQ